MNNKQQNRLNMDEEVIRVCDDHISIINAITLLVAIYNAFKLKIAAISAAFLTQSKDIRGFAMDKKNARTSLISTSLFIIKKLVAYAVLMDNNTLEQEVNFSKWELKNNTDVELLDNANIIKTEGARILLDIGTPNDYGLTQVLLDNQNVALTAYTTIVHDPRNAIIERHVSTDQIDQLFKDSEVLLKKIDKILDSQIDLNPEFLALYHSARTIVDLGHHHVSISYR